MTSPDMMLWQVLNLGTGAYDTVYSVPASRVSPSSSFMGMNAAQVNPVDTKNYGVLKMGSNKKDAVFYFCRFDAHVIEVLGKIGKTCAGTFDTDGTYYYSLTLSPNTMYKIEGVLILLIMAV